MLAISSLTFTHSSPVFPVTHQPTSILSHPPPLWSPAHLSPSPNPHQYPQSLTNLPESSAIPHCSLSYLSPSPIPHQYPQSLTNLPESTAIPHCSLSHLSPSPIPHESIPLVFHLLPSHPVSLALNLSSPISRHHSLTTHMTRYSLPSLSFISHHFHFLSLINSPSPALTQIWFIHILPPSSLLVQKDADKKGEKVIFFSNVGWGGKIAKKGEKKKVFLFFFFFFFVAYSTTQQKPRCTVLTFP